MTEKTILHTPRLVLRPWEEADAPACYEYAKDPRIGPMCGWEPHTSVENSRMVIREFLSVPETYAVVPKDVGHAVGSLGIMRGGSVSVEETEREIGYWIGAPFWGQGLIPEAVAEALRHCFEDLHCTGVWCGYFDGNDQSRRVQEKCGFLYHHTEKDKLWRGRVVTEHLTYMSRARWEELRKRG